MRAVTALTLCASLLIVMASLGSVVQAEQPAAPVAAACTSSVGPGIPPPASVPSGLPGFHAAWYGQSGYMTLCPGDSATATVAMYNSGSAGWVKGVLGQVAYLGTWNPIPGQDQPSMLGGDGQLGSPNTGWPRYNRVAIQPADYVGPNQVSWFQFGIRGPATPGTYDLYIRPLVEGATWMEDYGIFWRITVPGTPPVGAPAKLGCSASPTSIVSGSSQTSIITVQVQDANGLNVTTDNGRSITLSQAGVTGTLDASTKTTVNGIATFTLSPPGAGVTGTDQLSAATSILAGCVVNVSFTQAGAPASVSATLGQTAFPAGSPQSTTVTATLKDASGALATFTTSQTVTFTSSNTTICNISPATATINAGSSTATSTVTTSGVPGGCTVTATVAGLAPGSASLSVTSSGPAAKLAFTGNTCSGTPTTQASPSSTCDVTVQVQDVAGNQVFGPTPITLSLYRPSTATLCAAAVANTTPAGGAGNPATASTSSTGTTVKFTISDAVAEACDATATSAGLASATTTISFAGFGTPTQLSATASPNPIDNNGVSTSTITVCLKDAAGNTVTSANDSINLTFTSSTGGASHATTLTSSTPQVMTGGCVGFTVTSTTNPPATDTYTATDFSRSVPTVSTTITTN